MRAAWLALSLLGCVKAAPPNMVPDEALMVSTTDGWLLPVRHFPAPGPPVLLVHGMGANHYNFDYREEVSLAFDLQQRGFDVWFTELRGDPGARPPNKDALKRIDYDQYATLDLPPVIDAVLAETGEADLYWVGHSMGGMLLYSALAQRPAQIRAGVTVCSPGVFTHQLPIYDSVAALRWWIGKQGRIPAAKLGAATAPLGKANPLVHRLANPANLDPQVMAGLTKRALTDLPRPLAQQAIGWMDAGQLTRNDGSPWLVPSETPLLALGAPLDRVVAEADVVATCAQLAGCRYVSLSVATGLSSDYGHVDPMLGARARDDVYPLIADFLLSQERERHRAWPADAREATSAELDALRPLPWRD